MPNYPSWLSRARWYAQASETPVLVRDGEVYRADTSGGWRKLVEATAANHGVHCDDPYRFAWEEAKKDVARGKLPPFDKGHKAFQSFAPPDGRYSLVGERCETCGETPCPKRNDQTHCDHWYDGAKCCDCGNMGVVKDECDCLDGTRYRMVADVEVTKFFGDTLACEHVELAIKCFWVETGHERFAVLRAELDEVSSVDSLVLDDSCLADSSTMAATDQAAGADRDDKNKTTISPHGTGRVHREWSTTRGESNGTEARV